MGHSDASNTGDAHFVDRNLLDWAISTSRVGELESGLAPTPPMKQTIAMLTSEAKAYNAAIEAVAAKNGWALKRDVHSDFDMFVETGDYKSTNLKRRRKIYYGNQFSALETEIVNLGGKMPDGRPLDQQPPAALKSVQQEWVPRLKQDLVKVAESAKADGVCIDVGSYVCPPL